MDSLSRSDGSAAYVHEVIDNQDIIYVLGEIDISSCDEFAADVLRYSNSDSLTIDLTSCTYLDSSCLRVLAQAKRSLQERLQVVVPPSARIRRIFEITGLERHLEVIDSLQV